MKIQIHAKLPTKAKTFLAIFGVTFSFIFRLFQAISVFFFSKRRISAKNGDKWAHESGTDCRTDFWHHHKTNSSQNLGLSP